MAKSTKTDTDIYVGRRIRMRRNVMGLSQSELAKNVGVTFQQIQKYENGQNRVGGKRLQSIASTLSVSVGFFFDGAPGSDSASSNPAPNFIDEFLADKQGVELARLFMSMSNIERDTIMVLAKQLTKPAAANQHDL